MRADQWDKLPRTETGTPVVGLLTDPNGGPDGSELYVSLVDRGANMREFQVLKHDDPAALEQARRAANDDPGSVGAALEQGDGPAWWSRMFNWRSWFPGLSTKAAPPEFSAELAAQEVMDRLYRSTYLLEDLVRQILVSTEVQDKRAAISTALQQFSQAVLDAVPTLTAEQAQALQQAMLKLDTARVQRAGKVLSAANRTKLQEALDALRAVLEAADGTDKSTKGGRAATDQGTTVTQRGLNAPNAPTTEDLAMTPEQIDQLARKAADYAVETARKFNPQLSVQDAVNIGTSAYNTAVKSMVQGPAQPGIPTDALEGQIAMARLFGGQIPAPEGMVGQALGQAGAATLATKMDKIGTMREDALARLGDVETHLGGGTLTWKAEDGTEHKAQVAGVIPTVDALRKHAGVQVAPAPTPGPSGQEHGQEGAHAAGTRVVQRGEQPKPAAPTPSPLGGTALDFSTAQPGR